MRKIAIAAMAVLCLGAGFGLGYELHASSSAAASTGTTNGTHVCAVQVPVQPEFPDGIAMRPFPANVPCP